MNILKGNIIKRSIGYSCGTAVNYYFSLSLELDNFSYSIKVVVSF